MAADQTITLRLTIEDPVAGVAYSLQDAKSAPVGTLVATEAPISFEAPVRLARGRGCSVTLSAARGPSAGSSISPSGSRRAILRRQGAVA